MNRQERLENALPHPASLFGILAGFIILLSWIFSTLQITVARLAPFVEGLRISFSFYL